MEQLLINVILLSLVCWALLHSFTVSSKVNSLKYHTASDIHDLQVEVAVIDDAVNCLCESKMTDEDMAIEKLAKKYSGCVDIYMRGCHFDGMTDAQRDAITEYVDFTLRTAMGELLYPESEEEG